MKDLSIMKKREKDSNTEEEKSGPQTGSDLAGERSPDFTKQNIGKVGGGNQGYKKYP